MNKSEVRYPPVEHTKSRLVRSILVVLLLEKVLQHLIVSLAFAFNWMDIASTVALNPTILLFVGTIVMVLFGVALWGMIVQKEWAPRLVVGLALFDIFGEFVAQGTLGITITVSFAVAVLLLIVAVIYRRQITRRDNAA